MREIKSMVRQIESKTIFSAVDKISPIAAKITRNMTPLSNQLSKVGKSLKDFGGSTVFRSGAGLTGMFYGLLRPAMQVEKAMANIKKVFGEEKFGSFTDFQKDLTKLANNLNLSLVDIANLTSNLPIMATKNKKELLDIIELTRHSMETMDMDAVRASSSVKTFFNSVGRDYKQTKIALGAINELGNLHGVTNADLIDFGAMGALGTGISAGLQAKEVIALGSAYLSLGQTADRAKTSTEHLLKAMTISGGAKNPQREAFKIIGMTPEGVAEDFASKDIDKGHVNTIVKVLNKINALPLKFKEGVFAKAFGLEGLGGTKLLSKNLDMLVQRFKDVQNETILMNSLSDEYKNKIQNATFYIEKIYNRLKNLKDLMIISLLPTFKKIASYVAILADKYEKLNPKTKKMIGDTVLLTAGLLTLGFAIGGVSYALGGLAIAMGVVSKAGKMMSGAVDLTMLGGIGGKSASKIKNNWQKLSDRKKATAWSFRGRSKFVKGNIVESIFGKGTRDISKVSFSLSKLTGAIGIAITSFEVLSATVVAVGLPFLVLTGILILMGAIVYTVYKKWDKFKNKFEDIGNAFKFLGSVFGIEISSMNESFKSFGDTITKYVSRPLSFMLNLIKDIIIGLGAIGNIARYGFSEGIRRTENVMASMELKGKDKKYADFTGEFSPDSMKNKYLPYDPKNPIYLNYMKNKNDNMKIVVEVLGDKNAKVSTDLNGKNINKFMSRGGTTTPTLNYSPILR